MNFAVFHFIDRVIFKRNEMGEIFFISILISLLHTYHDYKNMNEFLYLVGIFLIIIVSKRVYWKFFR